MLAVVVGVGTAKTGGSSQTRPRPLMALLYCLRSASISIAALPSATLGQSRHGVPSMVVRA